ncbi:ecdysone-induced protein 78C [Trichonephila clavata]|uniref:Ecdysone-induced protein 78C n=1 Tax=Trichonephila clavata TaxID=2740835 RepID=A0A8X6GGZ1_TRICU|nr:ecdysone-induced protein 78C [Trichonephila clavata]
MSRDSVRYGRVPKRTRERMEETRVAQSENDQSIRDMESKELAIYDLTLTVTQAHHVNCDYTDMRTRGLVKKPAIFSLNDFQSEGGGPDSVEHQKIVMWQHFATFLTPSIQRIVEFAKKIPGFSELTQDDQLRLIKNGFFEVWIMHAAKLTGPAENTITFYDGSYITRQQIELMFDYEFVLALFNFVTSINSLDLNDSEIGLFSSVILLTSERVGIYDHKAIDHIQERLIEALKVPGSQALGAPGLVPGQLDETLGASALCRDLRHPKIRRARAINYTKQYSFFLLLLRKVQENAVGLIIERMCQDWFHQERRKKKGRKKRKKKTSEPAKSKKDNPVQKLAILK